MANQVVSQSLNFDNWAMLAYTNGDQLTIQDGATLTIDSEPQFGSQSAYLGNIFLLSGTLAIDGRNIKEVDVTASNITPVLGYILSGTTSQTAGEIVRVWGANTSGTLKVRNLLSGSGYTSGEKLTMYSGYPSAMTLAGGTTASTAAGFFRTGSLVVYGVETGSITTNREGTVLITGSWIDLGTSNGTGGQTFTNLPISGAIPGVWVETGNGTNSYEFWPNAGNRFVGGQIGHDSVRGQFISQSNSVASASWNRTFKFGDGVTGSIPPNGAHIRIPNVIICSTNPTIYNLNPNTTAINLTLASRYDLMTTGSGVIDIRNAMGQAFYPSIGQPYSVYLENFATLGQIAISEVSSDCILRNCGVGSFTSHSFAPLTITTNNQYTLIESGSYASFVGLATGLIVITTCNNVDIRKIDSISGAKVASGINLYLNTSNNITVSSSTFAVGTVQILSCDTVGLQNNQHIDMTSGSSLITTNAISAVTVLGGSKNILIDGYTSSYSQVRNDLFNFTNVKNIDIRNIYTGSSTQRGQLDLLSQPNSVINLVGSCQNIKLSGIYVNNTRTAFMVTNNSNTVLLMQNIRGSNTAQVYTQTSLNTRVRGLRVSDFTINGATGIGTFPNMVAVYGTHFYDGYINDTSGALGIHTNEDTTIGDSVTSYAVTTGSAAFDAQGRVALRQTNDEIEWTWPWYVRGHTGFLSQSAITSGSFTSNLLVTYAIDDGDGIYSAFKTASSANLTTEFIPSSSLGFKLKVRAKCITAATSGNLAGIQFRTTTTPMYQTSSFALYPTDEINATFNLTGIYSGSEVRIYRSVDQVELSGIESCPTDDYTFTYNYTWSGTNTIVDAVICNVWYQYVRLNNLTLGSNGLEIPIQQIFDRNYSNPA